MIACEGLRCFPRDWRLELQNRNTYEDRRTHRVALRNDAWAPNVLPLDPSGSENLGYVVSSTVQASGFVHADRMPQRDLTVTISKSSEGVVAAKDPRTYPQIRTRIEDCVRDHAKTCEVHAVDLSDPHI